MKHHVSRPAAAIIAAMICFAGYALMSEVRGASLEYDLVIDEIPLNFTSGHTMTLDTSTNDRAFIIHDDYLQIRSQYLTFWDFNETYEHEDVNLVVGPYCYAHVPAENLTLDSITEINRFQLSSWNGTVSVRCAEYDARHMKLIINSSDDATLLIRGCALTFGDEYRVLVDGNTVDWVRVNWNRYFEYNYTGAWSNHTVQFINIGSATLVPNLYLNLIQVFLYLGVFVVVSKQMILPLRKKNLQPEVITRRLIRAAIFIVVGLAFISIVFHQFVGV